MNTDNPFFCPAPFGVAYVDVKQVAYPCCKVRFTEFENDPECDLTKNDLKQAYNSKSFVELRQLFENNVKPEQCQECWSAEDSGCESERKHLLNRFNLETISEIGLKKLQIVPSVTCNFKCRVCDSNFSSAIAVEEIQHTDDKETKEQLTLDLKNRTLIDLDYYKRILEHSLPNMSNLQVLGGEPTLMKNLPELLEHIVDTGHHEHINLAINTNGSSWSETLINSIKKFKSCTVLISIDAVGKKFEDQRGGIWSEVESNFDRWLTISEITVNVTATVSIQNVLYVDEIVDFVNRKGVYIGWNYVDEPSVLCIDNVTETAKELICNKLNNHEDEEIRNIVQRVSNTTVTSGQAFIDLMDLYDMRRGTKFNKTHKEIYDAMLAK